MNLIAFVILAIVVVAVIVVVGTTQGSRKSDSGGTRTCPDCGTSQPHHAKFCRKCGKTL
jgi:hypothetical protein